MTRGDAPKEALRRAFVALALDPGARGRVQDGCRPLRDSLPELSWVRAEGVHLTLRFLGETPDATLELVSAGLEAAASVCPPLSGALGGLRLLPSPRRPRVLVVEVALPQAGYTLQAACEDAARRAGLEGEPRAFRPHVTLARVRKPVKVLTLPDLSFGSTLLEELTLFQSHLGRGGSVYTPIRSFPLGGA